MQKVSNRKFRLYSYPFLGIIMYLLFALINPFDDFINSYSQYKISDYIIEVIYLLFFTLVTVESGILVTKILNRFVKWEASPGKRIFFQLILQIFILVVAFYGLFKTFDGAVSGSVDYLNSTLIIRQAIVIGLLVSLLNTAIYTAQYFFSKWNVANFEAIKLQQLATQAQLDALKSQIDPHFLFNNFSTLTALIEEDKEQAIKYVTVLSSVYRYVLQANNQNTIQLKDELAFIGIYFYLYQIRYPNGIILNISIPNEKQLMIICPMTLQLLLENVVKHNSITSDKPITIDIYTKDNWLICENNLQPKFIAEDGLGVGIKNIKERYKILTAEKPVFEKTTSSYIVKIPLL